MTEKEIKRKLEDDGLRIADIARHLAKDFGVTEGSADTMLRNLIAGRQWLPQYASWLKKNYRVVVEKTTRVKPVRERMKVAT